MPAACSHPAISIRGVSDLVRAHITSALNLERAEFATHQSLNRVDRVRRVRYGLTLSYLAYQSLTLLGESDDRRSRTPAFFVWDYLRDAAFQYRHARVRSAEVYSDNFAHVSCLQSLI